MVDSNVHHFCFSNNIEVDPEKGAVEIYCELRLPLYSMAVINLNCSLVFSSCRSIPTFQRGKSSKSARHRQNQSQQPFAHESQATSLGWQLFATKSFHSVFGWCGTPSVSHSLSERLTSSQTVLATLSKNRMGFVCDFDGAGFPLILPLYA